MDDIIYVKISDETVEQVYTVETDQGELLDSDNDTIEAEL